MSIDARLNKLMPTLTAQERGVLSLVSLKTGTPEDPALRSTMPTSQTREFNHYIGLMNSVNIFLSHLLTFVAAETDALSLRLTLLFTMHLWQLNLAQIDLAASMIVKEPIKRSDYERLVASNASTYMSLSTAGYLLAQEQRAWRDEDLRTVGGSSSLVVKDDAWRRLCRDAEERLKQAVSAGEVEGRGSGKALKLRAGSFDAWLGRNASVMPGWASGYDVREDDDLRFIEDTKSLADLREAISTVPLLAPVKEPGLCLKDLMGPLAESVQRGIAVRWADLRALERVIDEVAAEFGGEDPFKPILREALVHAYEALTRQCSQMELYGYVVELVEPSEDDLEDVRKLLRKGQGLFD